MNAELKMPVTNLQCQHGISVAQTAWMYEDMGYTAAAVHMYKQAVASLTAGIALLDGPAPDDALFHLGASQLRLGCLGQSDDKPNACRQGAQAALPNLREAWQRFPNNPWYQQALVQASLLLGQLQAAQEVRERSANSPTVQKIGNWIDWAFKAWDRLGDENKDPARPIAASYAQPNTEWSRILLRDVFDGAPSWASANEY